MACWRWSFIRAWRWKHWRVAGGACMQMSANDSASLCDEPKASTLGLHRALFYNEQEGYLETFRPYALPEIGWIEAAGDGK